MNDTVRQYKNQFREFLDKQFESGTYSSKVDQMMANSDPRLLIKLHHFREFDSALAHKFQRQPNEYLPAFEAALEDYILSRDKNYFEDDPARQCHLGIDGIFGGDYLVTPRHLLSHYLGSLVCVEGIVTKCSTVLPKVVRTVHYCPATNKFLKRDYRDSTSLNGLPTGFTYPTKDQFGNPLRTEFGYCKYKDYQTFAIQEMPEKAPAGQLPRSVEVIVEDDLVDRVKPGDRVRVVGVYRAITGHAQGSVSATMKTLLIANNIIFLGLPIERIELSEKEERTIRMVSQRPDCFDLLSKSIAPSIFGHDNIKKSLLLQLIGGSERVNHNSGHHIRGDINILMVGDPSTAKSQLLRFMMHIAPLAISTTGRASTGVGLTAAVVVDPDTGDRSLQAGAMVLADRGIVCVDEFDKMNDIDRVAMHEVMEQQTVTIQKAGVHTTLNARCSVIAAANPIYGQYNRKVSIQRNVGLPDSLLSRFDLVFILLDERDPRKDRDIADHVVTIHRYKSSRSVESGSVDPLDHVTSLGNTERRDEDDHDVEDFLKFLNNQSETSDHKIPINLLRKYIAKAKRITPEMTEDARDLIHEKYCDLRRNNTQKTLPITARTLETIIRLSTGMAKLYMRTLILKEDVECAFALMQYAICFMNNTSNQEALNAIGNIPSKNTDTQDSESDADSNDTGDQAKGSKPRKSRKTDKNAQKPKKKETTKKQQTLGKRKRTESTQDEEDEESSAQPETAATNQDEDDVADEVEPEQHESQEENVAMTEKSSIDEVSFSEEQKDLVFTILQDAFAYQGQMDVSELFQKCNDRAEKEKSGHVVSRDQLRAIIDSFSADNMLFEENGVLFSLN